MPADRTALSHAATHRPDRAAPERPELRIASYNVHACVGLDGRRDVARIVRVIRELRADAIALQEVLADDAQADADQFALLSEASGLDVIEAPASRAGTTRFGNALLTRLPVLEVRHLDLTVSACEARGAVAADLEHHARRVRVVATHLGLGRSERRQQVDRLLAWIAQESRRRAPTLLVLAGDMNEWLPGATALRRLQRRFGRAPSVRSFPARRPLLRLDRIWASPARVLGPVATLRSPLARIASDHLPVYTELDLSAPPLGASP